MISNPSAILSTLSIWATEGHIALLVLGACSCVGMAIFIERLSYLRHIDVATEAFLVEVRGAVEHGHIAAAIQLCEQRPGAVANILRAGLLQHERGRQTIEASMELRGMIEMAAMERHVRILSIIAHISPLIGLLGTVLGFIKAFGALSMSGHMEISSLTIGSALEYALITTACGLVVAIPAILAYNYLVSRIEGMAVEIQAIAHDVLDIMTHID